MEIEAKKQRLIGLRAELIVAQEELRESTDRVEMLENQIDYINEKMRNKKIAPGQRAATQRQEVTAMDRAEPVSTPIMDITNGGVFVKGEEEIVDRICFEDEEEIVEREIKRKPTKTPEKYAEPEQKDAQGSREKKPGPKTAAGWRYRIKKALLDKVGRKYNGLYMCPSCLERKKLGLIRVNKNGDNPGIADYILLCDPCRKKRQEEQKKTRLWTRKPGPRGGSPQSTEIAFFSSIRALVFERDGKACVWCGAKEKLGLGPLIPKSRGGKFCFDNYVVTCQKCRGAKGSRLPLEYIWEEISLEYWLSEQLDDEPTVRTAGGRISIPTYTVAGVEQFLARRVADKDEKPEVRRRAEQLHIELSRRDEDRKKEREQLLW